MNHRMIRYTLGWLLLFEALFLLAPVLTALICRERVLAAFLWTMAACLAVGLFLVRKRPQNTTLYSREGFLIVAFSWILLSLFGCLPFYISKEIPSFINALFETVSGFTTTGASVLSDVESLSRATLLWRSFTHWVGGMGVLVFIMAFLPLSGGQNMHIMKAESPGPSVSKLVPRVRTTAAILYALYLALTLAEFILLWCGEMTFFEALNTALATAGTGGFGFRNDSMGSFGPYIQIVISVFMLLFSLNFGSYYLALRGRFKEAFSTEVRVFLGIVVVATAAISVNVISAQNLFPTVGDAVRHSFFTVSSIISSTGFSSTDFDLWPWGSKCLLILMMFCGACAGSTGGGLKVSRIVILFKGTLLELRTAIHPKQVKKVTMDGRVVERSEVRAIALYAICFAGVFAVSLLALCFEGADFVTGFSAVLASLNNIGPGLSLVGPSRNYDFFPVFSKIVLIFDMLAGRLELFPMLLLFSPVTWKKQ